MKNVIGYSLSYLFASVLSLVFLYPFYWMIVSSFRTQEALLSSPLRPLPENFDLTAYAQLRELGGVALGTYIFNSLFITIATTLLAVSVTALGAYALYRKPCLPFFRWIRYGFLLTMMYPAMLLVIPAYIVVHKLNLLGTYSGLILFMSLMPLLFLMFTQFFKAMPGEVIEAARMDGATEIQVLLKILLPMMKPILYTVAMIGFLLTWKQWLPILIIATTPDLYTLPVALLALNSEYGINFQSTMALAAITTVPVIFIFLFTQKHIIGGLTAGAVKG